MALCRMDLPGLVLYGGTIAPGRLRDRDDLTVQDVFEAIGAFNAGRIDDAELRAVEEAACPGAGACGGQYTANTMSGALEFLGLSPAGANGVPALHAGKAEAAEAAGRLAVKLVDGDVRPRSIVTRKALENAIAYFSATGGSTNAVLHLLAIAAEAEVPLSIEDFQTICARTPIIADLRPGGRFVATDIHRAGGLGVLMQRLLSLGLLHGEAVNVEGRSLVEVAGAARETPGQEVFRPADRPVRSHGGIAILRGNLAPGGCVIKLAGHDKTTHTGPAGVFDSENDAFAGVREGKVQAGDVVIIRYEGPVGGPGMQEMLSSPGRWPGLASTTPWPWSLTVASRGRPMASWSPTWSPRPRWAARWRRSATVTPSASTWPLASCPSSSPPRRSPLGWPAGCARRPATPPVPSPNTRRWSPRRARGRSPARWPRRRWNRTRPDGASDREAPGASRALSVPIPPANGGRAEPAG
jgi:Fe2+ transport system protein FeoA